jgi:chromate transporter
MVERYGWLTQRQFLEDYAISKISLGINLIAFAGLIGWRIARFRGAVVSVLGLLVPAGLITIAITAGYVVIREEPLARAAISGAGPAAAGMTVGVGIAFARQGARRGWRAAIDYSFALAALSASVLFEARAITVLLIGMIVGALFLRGETARASADPTL